MTINLTSCTCICHCRLYFGDLFTIPLIHRNLRICSLSLTSVACSNHSVIKSNVNKNILLSSQNVSTSPSSLFDNCHGVPPLLVTLVVVYFRHSVVIFVRHLVGISQIKGSEGGRILHFKVILLTTLIANNVL